MIGAAFRHLGLAVGLAVGMFTSGRAIAADPPAPSERELRVMTFNLWHGGDAGRQPLERTIEVIRAAKADIVGLQETHGYAVDGQRPDHAPKIAAQLGWHVLDQGGATAIISRYRIVRSTPRKCGVTIELPGGQTVHVFNVHLAHAPYQPYQLLKIPYHSAPFIQTADEAVQFAEKARGPAVGRMLDEMRPLLKTGDPVFVTGDFNEPSHLDWTAAAVEAGRCPLVVEWPSTRRIQAERLIDGFRAVRPDPAKDPGYTWTPTTQVDDPKDKHDRIDLVLATRDNVRPIEAQIVGENEQWADIVVENYPSDHRAVVVRFELAPPPAPE